MLVYVLLMVTVVKRFLISGSVVLKYEHFCESIAFLKTKTMQLRERSSLINITIGFTIPEK